MGYLNFPTTKKRSFLPPPLLPQQHALPHNRLHHRAHLLTASPFSKHQSSLRVTLTLRLRFSLSLWLFFFFKLYDLEHNEQQLLFILLLLFTIIRGLSELFAVLISSASLSLALRAARCAWGLGLLLSSFGILS